MTDISYEERVLGATMRAAVDAIVVSDGLGRIISTNTAAERLFGYGPGELVGQNVRILMPEAMSGQHDRFMSDYLDTGQRKIIGIGRDLEGLHKDGHSFPVHLSVGQSEFEGSSIFVAILHDLTRRRADEEALARTVRLEAISGMTGGIVHDFNNILTVVLGSLELAEMQAPDGKVADYIQSAKDAAETGAGLTSRLKVFARQSILKPELSDLGAICNRTVELLRRTLGSKYQITTDCPPGLKKALIDPVQFESALVNIAINARDAMPNGGRLDFRVSNIEIDDAYIAQEADVKPGDYVRIFISDDGDGMSPDVQSRAFEPFYTTKDEKHGTGLGLAMVYGFVKQSGGNITLYSEVGFGTSFGLYFPAVTDPGAEPVQSEAKSELPKGGFATVLVVEDNPKVLKITTERLHALNYKTISATNADEAYDILEKNQDVDVLFSDIVMPGRMNGYDLAKRVRAEFPDINVLLTSGYASDIATARMSSSSDYDILHKPYHQAELAARLDDILKRRGS